jgi:hypothetical protein
MANPPASDPGFANYSLRDGAPWNEAMLRAAVSSRTGPAFSSAREADGGSTATLPEASLTDFRSEPARKNGNQGDVGLGGAEQAIALGSVAAVAGQDPRERQETNADLLAGARRRGGGCERSQLISHSFRALARIVQ